MTWIMDASQQDWKRQKIWMFLTFLRPLGFNHIHISENSGVVEYQVGIGLSKYAKTSEQVWQP